jgi:1,4-dihydroxy-2-naphthoyl-CoA hydrolase
LPQNFTAFRSVKMNDDVKLSEDARELSKHRGLGELATKMGIKLTELSAERAVATMPVLGNTQPRGLLHGGAYLVLGETLGSFAANVHASPDGYAVGIEISASHSRSATEGLVTGTATAITLGKTLTVHEVVVTDDAGNRLSTVRITNLIRKNS